MSDKPVKDSETAPLLDFRVNRREFVAGTIAGVIPTSALGQSQATVDTPVQTANVTVIVNGQSHDLSVDTRVTLLDLLREQLHFTGTKKGCDHGQCGACTVLVNGRRINSCLSLAVMNSGSQVTTIEGLTGSDSRLHPMQAAFVDHDGLQCGYCTPGQICSAVAMLDEVRKGAPSAVIENLAHIRPVELTDEEISERMSGNICRCAAYPGIVAAIRAVAKGESS